MYYLFFCLPSSALFCLYFFHTFLFFAFFHQSYSDIDFYSSDNVLYRLRVIFCNLSLFFKKETLAQVFSREFS